MNAQHSLLTTALWLSFACAAVPEAAVTELSVGLNLRPVPGVASLRYEVTPVDCSSGETVGLAESAEAELLDFAAPQIGGLEGFDEASAHPFSDALFTLEPGCYDVRVTPLDDSGQPSATCAVAAVDAVRVSEGVTTEVLLVSQCNGRDFGALDGVAVINRPPALESLTLEPSAYATCGQVQRLCASLSDEDGNPLAFTWTAAATNPAPTTPLVVERRLDGQTVTECVELLPEVPGEYGVALTVLDLGILGGSWLPIEEILADQADPRESRFATELFFHAECGPSLTATLRYTARWANGFCAAVDVTNSGDAVAPSWTVVLDFDDSRLTPGSGVDATFVENGSEVSATAPATNPALDPGEAASFRFCGKHTGPDPEVQIVTVN